MDDLISRQAVIDALMEILDRPNHAEFLYTDEICKALEDLPSAQPQWIPVTVGLPVEKQNENTHDFEYVLCTTTFGDVRPYKFGCQMGTEKPHFWHGAGNMDDYVIAWIPLPEAYKGEEE